MRREERVVSSGDGSELLFAVKMAAHARRTKIENDIHAGAFGLCSGLGTSRSGRGGGGEGVSLLDGEFGARVRGL